MSEELLSEEEMSALMPSGNGDAAAERSQRRKITAYNFRRPDRLSKEQIRSLYLLHDLLANSLSSSLPLFLRAFTEVSLISVEQQSYSEYICGLSDPTNIFTFAAQKMRGSFAVEINSSIAFPIIDRMLGGSGENLDEPRPATELELKILEGFLSYVTDDYCEAWKPIIEFETELTGRETRPQLLQIAPPNEVVVAVVYQVQIGEAIGFMSICLPIMLLEPVIAKFNPSSYETVKISAPEAVQSLLDNLSAVYFPVTAELLPTPAMMSDLMNLNIGDVLRTNHRIEHPVSLSVSALPKFKGRVAAHEGKMVVRVTEAKMHDSQQLNEVI
jgi:flagellar motor switch protein FliM